jgi:predicted lipid-binding transport protein (Tim44 family)
MKQYRSKGSILGFVLVGALLTALVIGGVFAAKRYIAQNQANDAPSTTVAEAPVKETQKAKPSSDTTSTAKSDDLQKALQQQSAAEKKAQEQKAASEAASKEAAATSGSTASTSTTSLPTTGPEDSLVAMVGATLLAAAGVAYRRSRALI